MTTMVERVARGICSAVAGNPDDVLTLPGTETIRSDGGLPVSRATVIETVRWRCHVVEARAAIAAMREPTDEMLEAGTDEATSGFVSPVWRAMIDAALAEGKP